MSQVDLPGASKAKLRDLKVGDYVAVQALDALPALFLPVEQITNVDQEYLYIGSRRYYARDGSGGNQAGRIIALGAIPEALGPGVSYGDVVQQEYAERSAIEEKKLRAGLLLFICKFSAIELWEIPLPILIQMATLLGWVSGADGGG